MIGEVILISTIMDREKVRHFSSMIESIAGMSEDKEISISIGDIKALLNVVRDYAVMTHISGSDEEAAVAIAHVADYVEKASPHQSSKPTIYKTTVLAEIFDVSVTAINKWIDEGRFIGYHREPGKHAKIPHFTPFRLRDGSVRPLGKLIEEYSENPTSFADDDERQLLHLELERLKKKYQGKSYHEAFDVARELSPTEESDASWWSFYERKLEELNG